MSEWAYKVSTKKRSEEDTRRLADTFGFVARSAYKRTKDGTVARISNVRKVEPDHILHIYYVTPRGTEEMGSFRVLEPTSEGDRFEAVWPQGDAALAKVRVVEPNKALIDFLNKPSDAGEGYRHDPKLDAFTGWVVRPIPGRAPPRFKDIYFPRHHTLVSVGTAVAASDDGDLLSRVIHDPEVMGGKPCIRGTRVTVGTILGLLSAGHSFEAILSDFPYLTELDLRAALAYAAWRTQDRELPLRAA